MTGVGKPRVEERYGANFPELVALERENEHLKNRLVAAAEQISKYRSIVSQQCRQMDLARTTHR